MNRRIGLAIWLMLCPIFSFCQDSVTILTYNILNFPNSNNSSQDGNAARAGYFREFVEAADADVIIIQELVDYSGADILVDELNANGVLGKTYDHSTIHSTYDMCMLIYNADKFNLINSVQVPRLSVQQTSNGTNVRAVRANFHYHLSWPKVPTCPEEIVEFHVFNTHLKGGNDNANSNELSDERRRRLQIDDLLDYISSNSLENEYLFFGGDFNVYGTYEESYQLLIDNTISNFVDPLVSWVRNTSAYVSYYTQSTRNGTSYNNGGFGGGLDDRFDMILHSTLVDNVNRVNLIPGSYQVMGTAGVPVNGGGIQGSDPKGQQYEWMSDHYPVHMTLEFTNPPALCCVVDEFIQNIVPSNTYQVSNNITSNGLVPNGNNVSYLAGNCVLMNAGFEVQAGADFVADIDGCN